MNIVLPICKDHRQPISMCGKMHIHHFYKLPELCSSEVLLFGDKEMLRGDFLAMVFLDEFTRN